MVTESYVNANGRADNFARMPSVDSQIGVKSSTMQ